VGLNPVVPEPVFYQKFPKTMGVFMCNLAQVRPLIAPTSYVSVKCAFIGAAIRSTMNALFMYGRSFRTDEVKVSIPSSVHNR
jgi:hypothetical protein